MKSESASEPSVPQRGVEHAHVIDMMAFDPQKNEVLLTMVESRPWDGSELQLFQLQEKFNAYLSFALDGEMAEAYPDLVNKEIRIRLECIEPPDSMVRHLLSMVQEQVSFQGIQVEVVVMGKGGCGEGCGCG